jgi:hypothetical protein
MNNKNKIKVLFLTNCQILENFALEREKITHNSFLDKYYIIGKCDNKLKNNFDNINFITIKEIKKDYLFDYIYISFSINLINNIKLALNHLNPEGTLRITNYIDIDKKIINFLSINFNEIYNEDNDLIMHYILKIKRTEPIEIKTNNIIKEIKEIKIFDIYDLEPKEIDNKFLFSKEKNFKLFINNNKYDLGELYDYENLLKSTKRVMDSFNQEKYGSYISKMKSYKKLKKVIENKYTDYEISQAFLKMYEILETFDLFNINNNINNKKEFKSFHFCEAPGQFIKSCIHYLKTKNNNNNLDWYAQSLNPKKYSGDVFADDFNLIKDYPNRWLFGPDNSGNICDDEVVKSYKKVCKGVNLITSDCGLKSHSPWEMTYQDKRMAHINYCQILAILYNLPKGGNFVAKVFLPQTVGYIVSLNYIISKSCGEFHVYKPYLNPGSSEVYLIGKNYNPLPSKLFDYLFEKKTRLNVEEGFLKIEDPIFLKEYKQCFIKFIKLNLELINMNIYFFKNKIKADKEKLEKIYNESIDFWIEKFKFKALKKDLDSIFN